MGQATDDWEEEQKDIEEDLSAKVESIILGYLPFGVKVPVAALGNMSKDIHKQYDQALEEAQRLTRDQIIKIIRGTNILFEQYELVPIKNIRYEDWDDDINSFRYYIYESMLLELPDDELYAIFAIIKGNPV